MMSATTNGHMLAGRCELRDGSVVIFFWAPCRLFEFLVERPPTPRWTLRLCETQCLFKVPPISTTTSPDSHAKAAAEIFKHFPEAIEYLDHFGSRRCPTRQWKQ